MENEQISNIGRNDPCPCGSGKKYKKCHQGQADDPVEAQRLAAQPAPVEKPAAAPAAPGGFDPSQFSPEMMAQFTQMFQRLPKGQIQRFQSIMQKAMAGKDVSRESAEFEGTLPVEFQKMMQSLSQQVPDSALPKPKEKDESKGRIGKFWKSLTSKKNATP